MFNNLIESSSHVREFKRRGSFVLFTTAVYAVLFIVAGVASIYAYDARLEDQNLEFVTMLSPMDFPAEPAPVTHNTPPPRASANQPAQPVRQTLMASVNTPTLVPDTTSAKPNAHLPVPDHGSYTLGDHDADPIASSSGGHGDKGGGSSNNTSSALNTMEPPPALPDPPVHKPAPVVSKGAITGLAIELPKPNYPAIAKTAGASGPVNVQVLIDETGKVISAKAVSGHPLLMAAAQHAAYGARFSPTRLGEQPVKVSGLITYNFVLQ
jgi:periplasmic protein TonB